MENELAKNRESADIGDFGNLFMMIQNDSRLDFSVASFIRLAILERKSWMREVCAQGRPCSPPDLWNRSLFIGEKTCFLARKRIGSSRSFLAAASAIVIAGPIQAD